MIWSRGWESRFSASKIITRDNTGYEISTVAEGTKILILLMHVFMNDGLILCVHITS